MPSVIAIVTAVLNLLVEVVKYMRKPASKKPPDPPPKVDNLDEALEQAKKRVERKKAESN